MEVEAITVIYCGNSKYPGDCNYLKVSQTAQTEGWDGRTSNGKMAKVKMKDEIKRAKCAPNNFKIDDRKL